jgi:hypothetical protein
MIDSSLVAGTCSLHFFNASRRTFQSCEPLLLGLLKLLEEGGSIFNTLLSDVHDSSYV